MHTFLHQPKIALEYLGLGYEYVRTVYEIVEICQEQGSEQSLRSIALDGFAHLLTGYESEALFGAFEKKEHEIGSMKPLRFVIYPFKLSPGFESLNTFYTANLFLPFALRALITLRPFLVFIRARNPWVLLRRVLCG